MGTSAVAAGGSRRRHSREQWHELLEHFERSGQTREEFCRERGLTVGNFNRWRRALDQDAAGAGVVSGEPVFFEVASQPGRDERAWDIELELGAGVILRLRRPC